MNKVKLQLRDIGIKIPRVGYKHDAGRDLYMTEDVTIKPLQTVSVDLKISVAIPEGYAGLIAPRSSIAMKGLILQTQAIDSGYTGTIHLIMTNASTSTLEFASGNRIGSLIIYKIMTDYEFEVVESLDNSDRGENGLGSSNK